MPSASICLRSGNRTKSSVRTAAAPAKTAIFHIGKSPRTIPYKMNSRYEKNSDFHFFGTNQDDSADSVLDSADSELGAAGSVVIEFSDAAARNRVTRKTKIKSSIATEKARCR